MGSDVLAGLAIFVSILALGAALLGVILAGVGLAKASALRSELSALRLELAALRRRLDLAPPAQPAPPFPVTPPVAPAPAAPSPVPSAAPPSPPQPAVPPAFTPPAPLPPPSRSTIAPPPTAGRALAGIESNIGMRWIAWAGAVVVFFSAVFFLKYAFENNWIGPTGQVIICALVGAAIVAAGSYFTIRKWPILGQCLMGLGLAILYATFFAAFTAYQTPVMSQRVAFGFMVAVTAAGLALAILHNALSMAFLAVLGGFLTPVLLSTGKDARDALFTYILLLDLGVLAVAFFRGWRLLDTLALVGTFILYAGWYASFYTPQTLAPALAWLAAFYLVFLILPFTYHLVRRQPVTIERFIMALVNAAVAAGYAWTMLHTDYLFTMGFICLGLAAAYVALGAALRQRLPADPRALFGTIAMTVTFLTLAVPMQLQAHGILLAWVIEAPVLAALAYRFRYRPVRAFAAAILVLGIGRLFFYHWPLHAERFVPFFNRYWLSAMAVPAAAAAYAWIHQWFDSDANTLDRVLKLSSAYVAGFLALIITSAELGGWLINDVSALAAGSAVTALWAFGSLAYLGAGVRFPRSAPWTWGVGALVLIIAIVLGFIGYSEDAGTSHILLLNARFAAALLAAAAAFAYAGVMTRTFRQPAAQPVSVCFFVLAIVALLVLLSTEAATYCLDTITDYTPAHRAAQMAITLVWGLYAAALLAVGFWRQTRALRIAGLALFGAAALKLALVDLTFLQGIFRIVSFLVLGLLMLVASYLYHRLEKRLGSQPVPADAQP